MNPRVQLPFTVFRQLARESVPLRSSAEFGEGLSAACWRRDEVTETSYVCPNHHTLSLYVAGGSGIRRRYPGRELRSFGAGSLCLMPAACTTDWSVAGTVDLFHLYIPTALFERTTLATFDRDPAAVELPERAFFSDPRLERTIRDLFLGRDWNDAGTRLALSEAGQMVLVHILRRYCALENVPLTCRGGLAPGAGRRVREFIESNLEQPLVLADLAAVAGLSPYHFARMFKQSAGEPPHAYVLRRRVEQARGLLAGSPLSLAEIAARCGFSNQSHFTGVFRRLTGVTPKRYRAAMH